MSPVFLPVFSLNTNDLYLNCVKVLVDNKIHVKTLGLLQKL